MLYSDLTKSAQGRWGNANRMRDGLILTYPGGPTEQLLFPLFQPLRLPWIEILQSGSCQCSGSKRSQRTFNASICSERQKLKNLQLAHAETNRSGFPSVRILRLRCPVVETIRRRTSCQMQGNTRRSTIDRDYFLGNSSHGRARETACNACSGRSRETASDSSHGRARETACNACRGSS